MNRLLHFVTIPATVLVLFAGCATLPDISGKPASHALTDTEQTALGKGVSKQRSSHPGQSGLLLLGNGLDALVARTVLADQAERGIDAQYYLLHNDQAGRLFIASLVRAADRGVRVRLLLDDIDFGGRDEELALLDSHPNIEIRLFNPFSRDGVRGIQFATRLGSVTRRMHNKSFTVDNQVTIVGGRNIGDEYFNADPELTFGDIDLLAIGPVVEEVSTAFDLYWNSEFAYPAAALIDHTPTPEELAQARTRLERFVQAHESSDYQRALRSSRLAQQIRTKQVRFQWGEATAVYDRPEKITHEADRSDLHLRAALNPFIGQAADELIIFSAYFVPTERGVEGLARLSQRGVRVRILTNSLASNDVPVVHAGYAKYREPLLRAGIELYELNKKVEKRKRSRREGHDSSKASLHAKAFVVDRDKAFVGSLNFDPRSAYENTEIGIVVNAPELAEEMAGWFERIVAEHAFRLELEVDEEGNERILWHGIVDGRPRTFDVDPYSSAWSRFGLGIMGVLPIESEL